MKTVPTQKQAQELLWRSGILRFLLDKNQQGLYDAFYLCTKRRFVLNCGRRMGKSYLLIVLALEHALRKPGGTIIYIAPTKAQARDIVRKIFPKLLSGCPSDLQPTYFSQDREFVFSNGATIKFGAVDAQRADALRGSDIDFAVVDEAGFSSSLDITDMIESVLRPMALLTRAKICIASTPARTPRHAFQTYYETAVLEGAGHHRTVYDNPRLTPEDIEEEIKAAGGTDSVYWRREYMAEFLIDEQLVTFPEFGLEKQEQLVKEMARPAYFDAYVSIDVGLKDATAIIFMYFDFRTAQIVVEDESILQGVKEVRSDLIADIIKTKEKELWGKQRPYFRVADYDIGSQLITNELERHDIKFVQGEKCGVEAGVNEVRLLIQNSLLIIHPRCRNLIAQLSACVWNDKRDSFDRIEGYAHFDAVAALIIGVRNIRRSHNPYPAGKYSSDTQFFYAQPYAKSDTAKVFETLFKVKKPE